MHKFGRITACHLFVCYIAVVSTFGVSTGQSVKLEGYVVSQHGDIVEVQSKDAGLTNVQITEFTKISMPKGLLRNKRMPASSVLPGLWMKVSGVGNNAGHVLAQKISFSEHDLKIASAIQAGTTPLDVRMRSSEQQIHTNAQSIQAHEDAIKFNRTTIEANRQELQRLNQRFSKLPQHDVKYTACIHFPTGSAHLSPQAKSELLQLAKNALPLKEYRVQVKGFADSMGPADMNQELSMRRAQSVIAFLQQAGNIPVNRVLAPGAMGETHPALSNATLQGREENRRVEVQVLVSRSFAE
jgi:outer membrane protein OmpA-like peptidoglycan-associated protein